MNSVTDRNMRKSQQLGERKVGGKAIDIAWVNIKKKCFYFYHLTKLYQLMND